MAIELATVDLALNLVLKTLLLAALVYLVFILRNLDKTVKSVERSAESIERTSEKVGKMLTVSRFLPFIGRGGNDE